MTQTESKTHKDLIKRYHTLCSRKGLGDDEKQGILMTYEVESSKDLTIRQLKDVIDWMNKNLADAKPQRTEEDQLRKCVMAAIGGYLKANNLKQNAEIIKAIACRAAPAKNFNAIPKSRLRAIYSEFKKQNETMMISKAVKAELIEPLKSWN